MKNEHPKTHGGSAFLWGLVIGALLASLLTTKRGRRILRELSEVAFDLIENFIEEKTIIAPKPVKPKVAQDEVARDLESEVAEVEEVHIDNNKEEEIQEFVKEDILEKETGEEKVESEEDASIKKKRLFRGIRRSK